MTQDRNKIRKAMLAKIHIALPKLGMDDATYRELLSRFGLKSAKDADLRTLRLILDHLSRCGFKEKGKWGKRPRKLVENDVDCAALLSKIEALLADGGYHWNYGHALAKRICKIDRLDWCDWRQLRKIVAALEMNARRKQSKKGGES